MAMYLILGKYTAAGAAGVLKDGVATRPKISAAVMEAAGGKLHHWWAVADGDWHIAMVVERPDSSGSADDAHTALFGASTGAYEAWRVMRLNTAEEVDQVGRASQAAFAAFRAPGSANE